MPGERSAEALFGAFVDAARKHATQRHGNASEMSPAAAGQSE